MVICMNGAFTDILTEPIPKSQNAANVMVINAHWQTADCMQLGPEPAETCMHAQATIAMTE